MPRVSISLSTRFLSTYSVKLEGVITDDSNIQGNHHKFIPHFLSNRVASFSKHLRNKKIFCLDPEISRGNSVVLTVDF